MSKVEKMMEAAHGKDMTVISVPPDMSAHEAALIAQKYNIGALPVLRDGKLIGILTDRDYRDKIGALGLDSRKETVANIMTPDPEYVTTFTDILDCINIMRDKRIRHLPVLKDGVLVGIISIRDILLIFIKNQELIEMNYVAYGSNPR